MDARDVSLNIHGRRWQLTALVGLIFSVAWLLAPAARATPTENSGLDYFQECREAGVPIPPPFNFDQALAGLSEWTPSLGADGTNLLEKQLTLTDADSYVFYWVPPAQDGICMALPRVTVDSFNNPFFIELFGVICQGNRTSKSCFFDRPNTDISKTLCWGQYECGGPDDVTVLGGKELDSTPVAICTDCHAGRNAFIGFVDTNIDVDFRFADNWVDPIVNADWPQNPGPGNYYFAQAGAGSCSGCHDAQQKFPEASLDTPYYCERLLGFGADGVGIENGGVILNQIMPPGGGSLDGAGFNELLEACQQPGVAGRFGRALYRQTLGRAPTSFETWVIDSALSSGADFEEVQAATVRPYLERTFDSPPTIDGVLDASWTYYSHPYSVHTRVEGTQSRRDSYQPSFTEGTSADISAEWRAMWDESRLYLFVKVRDDVRKYDSAASPWNDDSVEVYIDGRNEKGNSYDGNDVQFIFRPGDSTIHTGGGRNGESTAGISQFSLVSPGGYTLEVSIPWSTLGVTPGRQMGFEVQVNDDDGPTNGTSRDAQVSWRTSSTDTWTNPSRMTSVDLPYPIIGRLTSETILIDGLDNEMEWAPRPPVELSRVPAPQFDSNNTAEWRSFWDEDYLYFMVDVSDSAVLEPDSANVYDDDSVEIFIDANNSYESSFDGYDDFQLIFRVGDDDNPHFGDESLSGAEGILSWFSYPTGGYSLEVAIPWSAIKSSPAEFARLGLEIQINDDDNGSTREGKLSWCSDNNDSYRNPTYFCVAQLLSPGEPPTPAIERVRRNDVAGEPDVIDSLEVDGNLDDELWENQTVRTIDNRILGSPSLSGTWSSVWNEEYLYFGIAVSDNGPPLTGSADWEQDDSVEIYLDGNHSRGDSYDSLFDAHYIMRPGNVDQVQAGDGNPLSPTAGIKVRATITSTASSSVYRMEVAIPWLTLGILPEHGANIGLELHLNDDDLDGNPNRVGKVAWSATEFLGDVAYQRPDAFAHVRLDDPAALPQPVQLFFDDFWWGGLARWTESGEGDWNTEVLHSPAGYAATGSGPSAAHADDCDATCTITLAAPISLAGYTSAKLEFQRFLDSELDVGEYLRLEVFNGTTWTSAATWAPATGDDDDLWHAETVNLDPYLGVSAFKLRFVTHSSDTTEHVQVDDVRITAQ